MFDASDEGEAIHNEIHEAFERVDAQYTALSGDAIPAVPSTWNPDAPSEADAASDYGQLFLFLADETDFDNDASFVSLFEKGGDVLGIPQLPE